MKGNILEKHFLLHLNETARKTGAITDEEYRQLKSQITQNCAGKSRRNFFINEHKQNNKLTNSNKSKEG